MTAAMKRQRFRWTGAAFGDVSLAVCYRVPPALKSGSFSALHSASEQVFVMVEITLSLAFYPTVRHEAIAAIFAGLAVAFDNQRTARQRTAVDR
jgi:hypothetical protein